MATAEISWFPLYPASKLRDFRLLSQFEDSVELALQLFLRKHLVNLGVAGAADPDDLPHRNPIEIAFVPLVVVSRSRNQMVASQRLFPLTNSAPLRPIAVGIFCLLHQVKLTQPSPEPTVPKSFSARF